MTSKGFYLFSLLATFVLFQFYQYNRTSAANVDSLLDKQLITSNPSLEEEEENFQYTPTNALDSPISLVENDYSEEELQLEQTEEPAEEYSVNWDIDAKKTYWIDAYRQRSKKNLLI